MNPALRAVPVFTRLATAAAAYLAPAVKTASSPKAPEGAAARGHSAVSSFETGRPTSAKFRSHVDSHAKGAYFRKVESAVSSKNQGITGSGTLPQVNLDASRKFVGTGGKAWQTGPLDRPSVYMGGRSNGKELDCGLSWDRVHDNKTKQPTYTSNSSGSDMRDPANRFIKLYAKLENGTTPVLLDVNGKKVAQGQEQVDAIVKLSGKPPASGTPILVDGHGKEVARGQQEVGAKMKGLTENFAFRPFWRDTNSDTPKAQRWHNPPVGSADNVYFYPGERFTMSVKTVGKEQVSLGIQRVGGKPGEHFSLPSFRQEGFGPGQSASFKRVNSIDQFTVKGGERVGAETVGKVDPTKSTVTGGAWDAVSLLRTDGTRQPMTGPAFSVVKGHDTAKRYGEIFGISGHTTQGGERIAIHPDNG
jgi:hypothetical protein